MDEIFDLKAARNNMVAKDNRLIQKSRSSLSLIEQKAILYLISKIKPDDMPGKLYVFNCREFQVLLNWNKDASYDNIKTMLKELGDVSWWIECEIDGRKKDVLVRWFNVVRMDRGTGDIEISFHEDMFPYLLELQKHREEENLYYTAYKLQNITLMKHRYSPRIYELLKSYQYNNQRWTFENGTGTNLDIQIRIAGTNKKGKPEIPDGWSNWAVFKRNVLDPAVEEINKYTDIKVAYTGKKEDFHHRKTRAIRSVEFYMVDKTELEQNQTNNVIDNEYTSKNGKYCQIEESVETQFFAEHKRKLEEDKAARANFERIKEEQKIAASKYPVLYEDLNKEPRSAGFTEEQIRQIYTTAVSGRTIGIVSYDKWQLLATDIAAHYYDYIMGDKDNTKSTVYNRLIDCLQKDYHQIVSTIQDKYSR